LAALLGMTWPSDALDTGLRTLLALLIVDLAKLLLVSIMAMPTCCGSA
jgi:hypothetical protein